MRVRIRIPRRSDGRYDLEFPAEPNPVALWRMPRSGGTMLLRCMRAAGINPVIETHNEFLTNVPVIITVRDFRDVACSHMRIRGDDGPRAMAGAIRVTRRLITRLERMKRNNHCLLWRYEDHWGTPWTLTQWMRDAGLVTHISLDVARAIEEISNPNRAAAIADAIEVTTPERPFRSHDPETGLHHGHVGPTKGEPGSWRQESRENRELLNRELQRPLSRWGYAAK